MRKRKAHMASGAVCIAYETVETPNRELPLLMPMSEVAGRMAVQEGAKYLEKHAAAAACCSASVPEVPPARRRILGGGIVFVTRRRWQPAWVRRSRSSTRTSSVCAT